MGYVHLLSIFNKNIGFKKRNLDKIRRYTLNKVLLAFLLPSRSLKDFPGYQVAVYLGIYGFNLLVSVH